MWEGRGGGGNCAPWVEILESLEVSSLVPSQAFMQEAQGLTSGIFGCTKELQNQSWGSATSQTQG